MDLYIKCLLLQEISSQQILDFSEKIIYGLQSMGPDIFESNITDLGHFIPQKVAHHQSFKP